MKRLEKKYFFAGAKTPASFYLRPCHGSHSLHTLEMVKKSHISLIPLQQGTVFDFLWASNFLTKLYVSSCHAFPCLLIISKAKVFWEQFETLNYGEADNEVTKGSHFHNCLVLGFIKKP
jgi:hypothetical protein